MSDHVVEGVAFRRPVSPTEWWFLGHPAALASSPQLVVLGTGSLTIDELRAAADIAAAACPGVRLTREDRSWVDSGQAPEVRVGAAAELLEPLPRGRCEIVVVEGEPSTIAFRADHSVCDAKGLLIWAIDVFRVLRGEQPLGAPDPVSDKDVYDIETGGAERTMPDYVCPPVVRGPIPDGQHRAVAGHRSIQGNFPGVVAMLAAFLVQDSGQQQGTFFIPVDLRNHLPGTRSTANCAAGFALEVPAGEDAAGVHERLLRELGDGAALRSAPPLGLLDMPLSELEQAITTIDRMARERAAYPSHAVISHAGRLELEALGSAAFQPRRAYLLARPGPGAAPDFNVLETERSTEISVSWWDGPETASHLEALLDRVVEALSPSRERVRTLAAAPAAAAPSDVVTDFLRAVAEDPGATALSAPEEDISYAELAHRTAVIAARLRELGSGPDSVVGVVGGRSASTVTGIWGVLRAGAAYLPLDAHNPDQRIRDVLSDAGARVCLISRADAQRAIVPAGCRAVLIEDLDYTATPDLAAVPIGPDQLAYVIYTSGSTGRPKGVEIQHGPLAAFARWAIREFGVTPATKVPLLASPGFDLSVMSLVPPLLAGATIVLRPAEVGLDMLRELLVESSANTLVLTPSHLALVNHLGLTVPGFTTIVVIGEQLTTAVAAAAQRTFGPDCVIVNAYGPTEATVMMTLHRYDPSLDLAASVPIGLPVDGNTVVLLDAHRRHARAGEIYIGGDQLARRYRGRPDLTDRHFVRLADGRRYYRSGDLARVLPSGELEFVGRIDDQVKVLGHRIEPAEIVAVLETHPAVSSAVVVPRLSGEHRTLCGYLVGQNVTADELQAHLSQRLPKYMVPSALVFVDAIPRTLNGKVDANRLPDPFGDAVAVGQRDPLAAEIAEIWAGLLDIPVDRIDENADFYARGGNSLLLLAMLASVRREVVGGDQQAAFSAEFGRLVREPTLGNIAAVVREVLATAESDRMVQHAGCPVRAESRPSRLLT